MAAATSSETGCGEAAAGEKRGPLGIPEAVFVVSGGEPEGTGGTCAPAAGTGRREAAPAAGPRPGGRAVPEGARAAGLRLTAPGGAGGAQREPPDPPRRSPGPGRPCSARRASCGLGPRPPRTRGGGARRRVLLSPERQGPAVSRGGRGCPGPEDLEGESCSAWILSRRWSVLTRFTADSSPRFERYHLISAAGPRANEERVRNEPSRHTYVCHTD